MERKQDVTLFLLPVSSSTRRLPMNFDLKCSFHSYKVLEVTGGKGKIKFLVKSLNSE